MEAKLLFIANLIIKLMISQFICGLAYEKITLLSCVDRWEDLPTVYVTHCLG